MYKAVVMKKVKVESGVYAYETKEGVFRADRTQGGWRLSILACGKWREFAKAKSLKIIEQVIGG